MSQKTLDAFIASGTQKVLAAVFMQPGRWWYRSELARHLRVPPSSLQKPLSALTASGLIRTRRDGNRLYYQANEASPLFPELRGLLAKTVGLVDVLKEALAPHAGKLAFGFVYGSVGRGEETHASDVDLMLVGEVGLPGLSPALQEAEQRLGREVNASVYSPAEFQRKLKTKHHFLTAVLDKPKLFVVGTEDDVARASEPGPSRT